MNDADIATIEASREEIAEASALAEFLDGNGDAPDTNSERVVRIFAAVRERRGEDFARVRGRRSMLASFSQRRRERVVFLRVAAAMLATAVGLTFFVGRGGHEVPAEELLAEREASARAAVATLLASRQESFNSGARASGIADSRYQAIYRSVRTERFESLAKEQSNGASSGPLRSTAPTRVPS